MGINEQLAELYAKHWDELLSELRLIHKDLYTNPFLLKVDEEAHANADFKVMIFGQETKGWRDEFGFTDSISVGMDRYDAFFVQKEFYKGYGKSAFWKGFRFFQETLPDNEKLKDLNIVYIWNNISKIGKPKNKTGVSDKVRRIERAFFPVVAKEIDIIKPDLIIFMTGPNRDGDIKVHLPDTVSPFPASDTDSISRALAIVRAEKQTFKAIRIYHPSFYKGFNKALKRNAIATIVKLLD